MNTTIAESRKVHALTGNTGSGKSTVAKLFMELGADIVDADQLARASVEKDSEGARLIKDEFGSNFFDSNGELVRSKLGKEVFSDSRKKEKLEAMLHPLIYRLYLEKITKLKSEHKDTPIIYDVPLFFESKLPRDTIEKIIVVYSDKESSIDRIIKRDSLSSQQAEERYDSQMPIAEKVDLADFVINNTGTLDKLREEVKECFKKL